MASPHTSADMLQDGGGDLTPSLFPHLDATALAAYLTAKLAEGYVRAAAAITTLGAVSLPGQVSFVTSIAPICLAMGIPIEPLAILIAVETIPDIFRTIGNVTGNLAVARIVEGKDAPPEADPLAGV